ncbi:MAG: oligosaccharide flippase family protein [Patescibacteria group bacterium]|nr:oligosaccharide flippase family protein [Patescibacteria group bacterium]
MKDSQKIAYNTIVQVIARAVTTLLSLVAVAYMLRYLGVEGYGQYTLVFAYLAILSIFVDFGFFLLQVREIAKHPEKEAEISGNVLGLKLTLSVLVFAAGYFLSLVFYDNPIITTGIFLGAFSQAAMALAQVPVSIFQARLEMHKVAVINVVSRAIYLGLIFWGIGADAGVLGLILMTAAANIVMGIISWVWVNRVVWLVPRWDFRYWKEFVREALPLGAALVLATIYFRIDSLMLGAMQNDYAVGIYGAPYKIIEVILSIATIFMSSVFPVLTDALASNRARAERIFQRAYEVMHLTAWPIVLGTLAVGTPLMVLIAGGDFAPSGPVLKILIFAVGLSFIGGTFNYVLIASGRQKYLTLPYFVATLFNVLANWLVIPKYSYTGAAATTVATELLVVIAVWILTRRELGFLPTFKIPAKACLSAGVMFGVLWYAHIDNLFINIALGGVVYIAMIFLTKAVDKQSIRELIRPT